MWKKAINIFLSLILIAVSISPSIPNASGHEEKESTGVSYNDLVNRLNENIRKQNELRQKIAADKLLH